MSTDLSQHDTLIGDLVRLPNREADWQSYQLTGDQLTRFREQGFLAGVRILSEQQVDVLRDELSALMAAESAEDSRWYEYYRNESTVPNHILFHALGAWRMTPGFHDLLWHPALTVPASQLLGGAVRFWHDQLFCKPARHGGVVAWHQDYSYWTRTTPIAHLTCWIALDDSSRDNGCVQYVPGSHRWDLLPITGLAGDMQAIRQVLTDEQWSAFERPVAAELKRGECVFHHSLTVHGSFENHSDRDRRATVVNVFRDGVCSSSSDPPLPGVPATPPGQPMMGRFFPLLHDPVSPARR